MKTINLIRHAKSDWSNIDLNDFDRGLSKKGEKQTKYMGKLLKDIDFETDYIICSTAKRALLTLEGLNDKYNKLDVKIDLMREIYDYHHGSTLDMINIIREIDDDIENVTIIGHNPVFDELLNYFINSSGLHMRTLSIAKITFDTDSWENIKNNGKLITYLSPEI